MRRYRGLIAGLALIAVAVLLARPIALDAIGAPYGSHHSPDVKLTQAEGSPHCALLADCETVSISNAGLDLGQAGVLLVISGLIVVLAPSRVHRLRSWLAPVPDRPPLASFA